MSVRAIFGGAMLIWAFLVIQQLCKGRLELLSIAAGFIFFQFANWSIEQLMFKAEFIDKVGRESFNTFINTAVSLLHSLLVACSVGICVFLAWRNLGLQFLEFKNLYFNAWPGAYAVLGFSCGYFAYDQVDMLRRLVGEAGTLSLLVHHFVLLNCFTLALFRRVSINYLILTLVCEMHSVFLHWRRVGRMLGLRRLGSKRVRFEWFFNWMTFFVTRTLVHLGILFKLVFDATDFPSKAELFLAASGMIGLNILNALLGLDLIKACSKELRRKETKNL